jgi:hypothetical protein
VPSTSSFEASKTWMPATGAGMTDERAIQSDRDLF